MAFEKGMDKTGGRQKGSTNKLTEDARKLFLETLEGEVPHIKQAFDDVLNGTKDDKGKQLTEPNPLEYLKLFSKYAQYFVPKKMETNLNIVEDVPIFEVKQD